MYSVKTRASWYACPYIWKPSTPFNNKQQSGANSALTSSLIYIGSVLLHVCSHAENSSLHITTTQHNSILIIFMLFSTIFFPLLFFIMIIIHKKSLCTFAVLKNFSCYRCSGLMASHLLWIVTGCMCLSSNNASPAGSGKERRGTGGNESGPDKKVLYTFVLRSTIN